jgi:hypothetical protein
MDVQQNSSAEHKFLNGNSGKLSANGRAHFRRQETENDPANGKLGVISGSETIESNQRHRNQHPNVRISVAESASKRILDQHRVKMVGTVGMVGMVGIARKVAISAVPVQTVPIQPM